jgi:5-(carboxyamino)imidazole ribonucleotide synthase
MTKPIIGILGGGQLGMMLCDAAKKIGIETHIFCPEYDCPSKGRSTYFSVGDYTDQDEIIKFANNVDYITYEFENIPIETIDFIKDKKKIRPGKKSLLLTQDRLTEKKFLDKLKIPIAPYKDLITVDDISSAQDEFIDSIIKTRTLGYDGKGQFSLKDTDDPNEVFNKILNNSIIEKRIPFEFEVSVIIARDIKGSTSFFPIGKNIHENHILKHTYNPISLSENQTKKLVNYSEKIIT